MHIDKDMERFLNDMDESTAKFLKKMSQSEDWVVQEDEYEYSELVSYIEIFLSIPDIHRVSILAKQLLGWVSAPQCMWILKELSINHPETIRVIFNERDNSIMSNMVMERLSVLERHTYLMKILNPSSLRSIAVGLKHYHRQNQEIIDGE